MKWLDGRVVARKAWTEHHFSLSIEADLPPFEAGQFVRLGLDVDGQVVGRPYSLVNPPDAEMLEIYFDIVPGGPLSTHLSVLDAGDPISVGEHANGFLVLSEVPDGRDLWLIASGTGVGPFLSMLRTPTLWQRFENVRLVYAVRHARELAYPEVVADIEREHGERFRFIPFVSRESCDFALSGRIPAAIAEGRLQERAGLAFSAEVSRVMLCGNPGMVEDATEVLKTLGLAKHRRKEPGQILTENYW